MRRALVVAFVVVLATALWRFGGGWSGPTREKEAHDVPSTHTPREVELARVDRQRGASRHVPEAVVDEERAVASEKKGPQSADIATSAEPTIAADEHAAPHEPFVRAVHVTSAQRDAVGATVEFHAEGGEMLVRSTDAGGFATLAHAEVLRGPWKIVAARLGECPLGYRQPTYRAGGATVEIELVPVQMLYVAIARSDGRVYGEPFCGEETGVWLSGTSWFRNAATGRGAPDHMRLDLLFSLRSEPLNLRTLQIAGMRRSSFPPGVGWLGVLHEGADPLVLRAVCGEADTESVVVEARAASLADGGAFVPVVLPVIAERELGTVVLRLQEPYPDAACDCDELGLWLAPAPEAPAGARGFSLEVFSDRLRTSGSLTRFEVEAGTYDVRLEAYTQSMDSDAFDAALGRCTVAAGETVTIDVPLPDAGAVMCADSPSDLVGRGSLQLLRLDDEDLDAVGRDVDFEHTPLRCGWLPPGRYVALVSIRGRDGWAASLCEPGRGPVAADWSNHWLAGDSIEDVYPPDVDGEPQRGGIVDLVEELAFEVVAGRITTLAWYEAPVAEESED